jgi:hypothetical protein
VTTRRELDAQVSQVGLRHSVLDAVLRRALEDLREIVAVGSAERDFEGMVGSKARFGRRRYLDEVVCGDENDPKEIEIPQRAKPVGHDLSSVRDASSCMP